MTLNLHPYPAPLSLISSLVLAAWALPSSAQAPATESAGTMAAAAPLATVDSDHVQRLDLNVGKQQLLEPGTSVARIAIGDPSVLDVKVLRDLNTDAARPDAQLLLTPKAAGQSSLSIWTKVHSSIGWSASADRACC